ncbi:MAG TPA: phosphatidate cytidylyltransferase [Chloroflexota bacterium]|nr:phosphatidate cytidylyltransferase [Chloroflexota bacterium]
MLIARIASAVVAIPIIVGVIWLGGPLFFALLVLAAALAARESIALLQPDYRAISELFATGGTLVLVAGATRGAVGVLSALAIVLVANLVAYTLESGRPNGKQSVWPNSFVAAVYAGLPGALLMIERSWSGSFVLVLGGRLAFDFGAIWVLLILTTVWAVDTAAYAVGRLIGRHLLWPAVSPQKTWEGTCAGLLAGAIVSFVWAPDVGISTGAGGALGLILAIAAILGDLAESALKRHAGVKDAGQLIPGHGGILDRIDSLVFSVIVVFLFGTIVGFA